MEAALDILSAKLVQVPAFVPAELRARLPGQAVAFDVPREVRMRLRSPEKMKVSEWAALHRTVAEGAHEGPWRHELAPHTVKIMDSYGLPWVREVWFCGVEQSGKTNTMLNCMAWAVDCDPGNIFYLMPTEDTSAKIVGGKIKPTFQRSPRLARYLPKRADDITLARINLVHGVTILPAWANSPSSMATWSAKHCFGDEVDKYPPLSGRETDPISLLKKRNRNYRGRFKRFFGSTPAGLFIFKGMRNCHQVWEWRVKCGECESLIRMDAEHLVLPEGITPEQVERDGCGYACNECGAEWDDRDREAAIRSGRWECVQGEEVTRPAKVGFHHRAWECLDVPLAEIGAAWLRAQDKSDVAARIAWANGYEAVDYEPDETETPELAGLIERREAYAPVVPMAAALLTAGVDVQADRIEVEVVAWGPGAESWGMEYAVLYGDTSLPDVWGQLDAFLMKRYRHESGVELPIARAFVDDGYRTHMVVRFTGPRLGRGVFAVKGASDPKAAEVRGPNQVKIGGAKVRQFLLGTQRLKSMLFGYFGMSAPGAGYCHVPECYPAKWFEMLQAEHLVTRRVGGREVSTWEKVKASARNEAIDCRAYALAALLSLRVDLKARANELKAAAAVATEESINRQTKRKFTKSKGVQFDD